VLIEVAEVIDSDVSDSRRKRIFREAGLAK